MISRSGCIVLILKIMFPKGLYLILVIGLVERVSLMNVCMGQIVV